MRQTNPTKQLRSGAIMCLILFMLAMPLSFAGEPYLSAEEALERVGKGELVLVDIRTPGEWRATGVAKQARTISMHRPQFQEKILKALGGDKTKPIALICARGGRSDKMQAVLSEAGYKTVYDVRNGMLGTLTSPGWIDKKLPLRIWDE